MSEEAICLGCGKVIDDTGGHRDCVLPEPAYPPEVAAALEELDAMRKIVIALAPLTPRMRAAILYLVREKLEDERERAQ
jgi:hypothetical protein